MRVDYKANAQVADILNKLVCGDKLYVQSDYIAVGADTRIEVYPKILLNLVLPYITMSIPECDETRSVWIMRKKYIGINKK